jgi:hypothetical protein
MLILGIIGAVVLITIALFLLRIIYVWCIPYEKLSYNNKHFKIKLNFWLLKNLKINKKLK